MKTPFSVFAIIGCQFLLGTSSALTPFSDNFNAAKLNTTNWLAGGEGGAKLKQSGGRLNFTVPSNLADEDYAFIQLLNSQPGYNESWQVIVDVTNTNNHRGFSGPGLWVYNADDGGDTVFLELYGKGTKGGFVASFVLDGQYTVGKEIRNNPAVSKGSIRISFNKTTKLLTFWFDKTGSADGYKWTKLCSFSPTGVGGDRRGNWNMNNETGRFNIKLYGFSEGRIVAPGTENLDNFVLKRL